MIVDVSKKPRLIFADEPVVGTRNGTPFRYLVLDQGFVCGLVIDVGEADVVPDGGAVRRAAVHGRGRPVRGPKRPLQWTAVQRRSVDGRQEALVSGKHDTVRIPVLSEVVRVEVRNLVDRHAVRAHPLDGLACRSAAKTVADKVILAPLCGPLRWIDESESNECRKQCVARRLGPAGCRLLRFGGPVPQKHHFRGALREIHP